MITKATDGINMSIAAVGAADYAKAIDGLSLSQAKLLLNMQGVDAEQQKSLLLQAGLISSSEQMTAKHVAQALATTNLDASEKNRILTKAGLMDAETLEILTSNSCTEAKLREALATTTLDATEKDAIVSKILGTNVNGGYAISFDVLTASIWANIKALAKWLITNPAGWAILATAAIAGLVKGYDTLIGRQEKLADQKLENINENIDSLSEEISALEELQVKLENAKGNKSELAQIQNELNDAIGETTGLLNGEGKAYEIANAKLKANIELKKQQRDQALKDKIAESKVKFDNNVLEVDWSPDIDASKMREYAHEYTRLVEMYNGFTEDDKKKWKVDSLDEWLDRNFSGDGSSKIDVTSDYWTNYWDEQVQTAYDAFDDVIQNYNGFGGQDFIKNIINNMVRGGSDLSQISDVIFDIINNQDLQDKINEYWASLVDPEINSEKALNAVKTMIDGIIKQYPQLEAFFTDFYSGIVNGATAVADTVSDATDTVTDSRTKMISSINDMSEGFEELDKIYSSIKDDDPFDFKLLDDDNFKETFGELESYADFIEQITSNSDDIDACQLAFNNLVTEWIRSTGVLNNLTDENASLTVSMLKQMGIANAEEIVLSSLNAQKEASVEVGKNFADITEEEIDALIAEGKVSAATCQYLSQLRLAKLDVNKLQLDTKSDVNNILAIANAAGASVAQIYTLKIALENLQSTKSASLNALKKGVSVYNSSLQNQEALKQNKVSFEDQLKQAQKEVQGVLNSIQNSAKLNASDFYADYTGGSKSNGGSGGSQSEKEFNWIETLLSRIQNKISDLGKTASATWKSWTDRNSALKDQMSAVSQEISLQQQAISRYESLAGSLGLSSHYQTLVKNGALDISTITDDNLADKISKYQEYWEKIVSAEDAIQDLEDELRNLARTEFDNITKQFDSEISLVEANISTLEAYIDQTEMKGNLVSKNYYSAMYAQEQKNLSLLQQKYDQLSNKLSNGTIAQGSEEWNSMSVEIKEVSKAIIESNTALEEYQKTMRELDWKVFDLIEEKIGNVTEESEFLIDLLSNSKLFNDNGSITSQGQATLGLHVANMKVYESQVSDYAQAIADLDKEFANDSLDQNYLDRREELVSLQRDMILQAQEERNSIKDLMSQGYDNLLSYMDELIAKRKELLSQTSDARSFQKTVQEQTDEIARLQNIINSYGGSLSEEDRAIVQKHQVSLEKAESDLEDTLYDKYVDEQQKMLDALTDDTEQFISERLENTDKLISDVVEATDANTETIKTTLETEVRSVGGTLTTEMQNLWSGSDGIKGVVGGVNNTLLDIKALVQSMVKGSDTEASKNASGATSDVKPATKPATTPQSTPATTQQSSAKAITVGGMINASGALIYDYAGDTSGERQYYRNSPYYRVLSEKNGYLKVRHQSLSSGTTGWFKKSDVKAYKTGGLVDETGLAWLDGTKGKPEMVLSAKDTENFLQLKDALKTVAQTNLFENIQRYAKLPNFVPNATNNNQQAMIIQGDIVLEGVQSPEDLARKMKEIYQGDVSHVRKTIRADVYGGMLGKNSLTRYKY